MGVHIQHYDDYVTIRLRAKERDLVAHLERDIHPGEHFMNFEYKDLRALGEGEVNPRVFKEQ